MTTLTKAGGSVVATKSRLLGGRTARENRSTDAAVLVLMALLAAIVFWFMHRAMVDDAYITLAYIRELAFHGNWGMLPGRVANTATSPLNVLLGGLAAAVTRGPVRGVGILSVLTALVLTAALLGLGRQMGLGRRVALAGAPLLLLNPLLASAAGQETMLAVTAVVVLLWVSGEQRPRLFGVVAGLTVLVRLDLVVVVLTIFVLRPGLWRSVHRALLAAALVAMPWHLFSWVVLGSFIPDTFQIRAHRSSGMFWAGLVVKYGPPYPVGVAATLAPVVLGVLAVATWRWWRRTGPGVDSTAVPIAAAAGLVYYLTFIALGAYPYFWYYGVPVAAMTLCAAAMAAALSLRPSTLLRGASVLAITVALVPTALAWGQGLATHTPLRYAVVKGNWAEPWQYAEIGRSLRRTLGPDVAVQSPGEIGTLLYFCECKVVDAFDDRGRLAPGIEGAKRRHALMRANYLWLDAPGLKPIPASYRLEWRPGRDPSGKGWNVFSLTGHRVHQGHLALLRNRTPR